jgi:uncharacterized protein YndB with AHSA1/START domain
MTVTNVEKDAEKLTLAITTDLNAGIDRVWQMWENPRLLEKWWGPPTYPATFDEFNFEPGGVVTYFMTSPEGEKYPDKWVMKTVDSPSLIEINDGHGEAEENPVPGIALMRVDISEIEGSADSTRMTITTTYESAEGMKKVIEMGMEEGMTLAMGQIDALL